MDWLPIRSGLGFVLVLGVVVACDNGKTESDGTDAGVSSDTDVDVDTDSDTQTSTETHSETSTATTTDSDSFEYPIDQVTVSWFPCSLHEDEDDNRAACAQTEMPLFWGDSDKRTIEIYAKRILGNGDGDTQLWLLSGGPGASGVISYPPMMERLQALMPGLDVYTLDHRGTGYSLRLGCPDGEAQDSISGTSISSTEMVACIETLKETHGDVLDAITTTQSAIDLAAYIHAARQSDKKVIVWGGSYGSYWAQRYVQVFERQADGVVLEGIAPPDATFIRFDENANRTAERFMGHCGQDPYCVSMLGEDPWAKLCEVFSSIKDGACPGLPLPYDALRSLFSFVLYYFPMNSVVPAVVYRLDRCDSEDVAAVVHLYNYLFGAGGTWDINSYSILLQNHIQFSEMWDHPDFAGVDLESYFYDVYDSAYVAKNLGFAKLEFAKNWPVYTDEIYDDKWSETELPMLMLQGKLDPATAWEDAVPLKEHFSGPHQHFVTFDNAPHGVTRSTPTSSDQNDLHCGMRLFLDFLDDPTGDPDLSCLAEVLPIDFEGTPERAVEFLGTAHYWDNTSD